MKPKYKFLPLEKVTQIFITISLIQFASFGGVDGTLNVINEETNETVFSTEEAGIDSASAYGLKGHLIKSIPPDACTDIEPPPQGLPPYNSTKGPKQWILLATLHVKDDDNACSLSHKAKTAQFAGYSGIILRRIGTNDTEGIIPKFIGFDWIGVKIYACVVGDDIGALLMDKFSYPSKYFVRFDNEPYYPIGLLANFVIVGFLAILTVLLLIRLFHYLYFSVTTRVVERRRIRKSLLSESQLRKLPILKWANSIPQDTCSICIELFQEGDEIRVLPCSHVFHALCVDPWLLKESRKCPNCKGRVLFPNERRKYHYSSDSESESERDERTPLLRRRQDENHRFIETLVESQNSRAMTPSPNPDRWIPPDNTVPSTTSGGLLAPTGSAFKGSKSRSTQGISKVTFAPSTSNSSRSTTTSSSSTANAFVLPMAAKPTRKIKTILVNVKPPAGSSTGLNPVSPPSLKSHDVSSSSSSSGGTLVEDFYDPVESSDDEMLPVTDRASPCSFTESLDSKTLSFHSCNGFDPTTMENRSSGSGKSDMFYSFSNENV